MWASFNRFELEMTKRQAAAALQAGSDTREVTGNETI
jgi:hypothetical protein